MTRDAIDTICKAIAQSGHPHKARLISDHDAEQREKLKAFEEVEVTYHDTIHKQEQEIAQLQHAYQQLADAHEQQHQEVTRLRELLRAGKSVAQMAMSFDVEEYPIMVNEAIAFLDTLTQEST